MAKLPDYTALGASPTPRPSTRAQGQTGYESAEGDALKALGVSTQEMAQTIEKVQDTNDKYAAEDAYNSLLEKKMDLTFGEDGFTKKKGKDAATGDLMNDYDERMGQAIEDIGAKLTNPRQQKYYRDRARIAALQYKQDVLKHVTTESDHYKKEVFGSTLQIEENNAATQWRDPNAIYASQTRINAAIDQEGDRQGWSKQKIKQAKIAAASSMHIKIIQSAISGKDPTYARSWFNVHKKEIDPQHYHAIEGLIKDADLTEFGQRFVDDVKNKGLNEQQALERARKLSGEEEEKAKTEVKKYFAETQSAADDNAYGIYAEHPGSPMEKLDAIKQNLGVWNNMSGKARDALTRRAKADRQGGVPNGGGDYYAIRKIMLNDFNQFKQLDLSRAVLNDGNLKELIDIQTGEIKYETALTEQQIMDDMLEVLGGDRTDRTSENSIKAYNRIKTELRHAEAVKGKALTKREMQDKADDMRIEVLRNRSQFSPMRLFSDTYSVPAAKVEIPGVPTEYVDEIAVWLRDNNYPVTEDFIKQRYNEITRKEPAPLEAKQPSHNMQPTIKGY